MKWGIHKAITKAVCSRLNVQPIKDVVGGSVLPDVEPDYTYRVKEGGVLELAEAVAREAKRRIRDPLPTCC